MWIQFIHIHVGTLCFLGDNYKVLGNCMFCKGSFNKTRTLGLKVSIEQINDNENHAFCFMMEELQHEDGYKPTFCKEKTKIWAMLLDS
jgi:hypothetical protein